MPRSLICMTILCLVLAGCETDTTAPDASGALLEEFKITDTNGRHRTFFHPGEEFVVSYYITNTTAQAQPFECFGPPVVFSLTQGDSVISMSRDGWTQLVYPDTLAPGQSTGCTWLAPSEYWRDPVVVLSPGSYRVNVLWWPQFESIRVTRPPSVDIIVTP